MCFSSYSLGLLIFLFNVNRLIASGSPGGIIFKSTIISIYFHDSPFQTPLSTAAWYFCCAHIHSSQSMYLWDSAKWLALLPGEPRRISRSFFRSQRNGYSERGMVHSLEGATWRRS
ncbi:hypothetical protein BJY52DRAFT_1258698 [Lactarius psammicola]|nr:hypothetical protein BJY52DRAFT_1258698 [Lactarius psammicola]